MDDKTCASCEFWVDEDKQISKTIIFPHKTCSNEEMWVNLRMGTTKECRAAWISPTENFGCRFHKEKNNGNI